jgi:hypothetical protein
MAGGVHGLGGAHTAGGAHGMGLAGLQGVEAGRGVWGSVVYCDVTERNRVAMSHHRYNVPSHHYDGSRRCCYSGAN